MADPPGHRRRLPVRQRRRARHRRVPARAARPGDGHQHDGRRGRARDRPGARRRARRDLVALGVLVQRPVRARRRSLWAAAVLHELARPDTDRAARPARHERRSCSASPGSCSASRKGGLSGWNDPLVIGGLIAGRRAAAALRADRAARAARRCSTSRSSRTACSPPPPAAAFINGLVALRADVRLRLLLPGRAGRRPDHRPASSSRRWRSGCSISSPLAGMLGRPPRLARAGRLGHARVTPSASPR